jgi:ribonuclease J
MSTLHDFIEQRGIKLRHIHTSGHASIDTMKKLTTAIQPKLIVPIHTSYPERYSEIFPEIRVANVVDGESISI